MNIALIAHDNKKELMAQFCTAYCGILAQHTPVRHRHHRPDHLRRHGADHPPVPVLLPRRRPADRCPHRLQRDRSGAVLRRSPQQDPQRGHRQHLSPVRPEQHPLCQQSGLGGDAGAGSGPRRSGLAQHRQSQNQALYRLTFPCISPTIDCVQTAMTEHE